MFAENQKISVRQLEALLLLHFFGTAMLFLPGELAKTAGNACWITTLLWGVAAAFTSLLLTELGARGGTRSALGWYRAIFGKIIGAVLGFGLLLKLLFDGAMELRIFSEVISRTMLPKTPLWLLGLCIILLCFLPAAKGIECSARAGELLFFLVFVPLLLVLLAVAVTADYQRILPLTLPSFKEMRQSGAYISPVFQGLVFLTVAYPYLESPKKVGRRIFRAALLGAVAFTALVFLCLAVYGKDALAQKLMPTLQMMEKVSFTGIFLGRQDLLLLWFWMATVFLFISMALFFVGVLGRELIGKKGEADKKTILIWAAVLFGLSQLPKDLEMAQRLRHSVTPLLNGIFLVALPILLLGIHTWKRRRRHEA